MMSSWQAGNQRGFCLTPAAQTKATMLLTDRYDIVIEHSGSLRFYA
jgi:hypothetical protein